MTEILGNLILVILGVLRCACDFLPTALYNSKMPLVTLSASWAKRALEFPWNHIKDYCYSNAHFSLIFIFLALLHSFVIWQDGMFNDVINRGQYKTGNTPFSTVVTMVSVAWMLFVFLWSSVNPLFLLFSFIEASCWVL